ncbi:MAG TPA: cyclase family protein [Pyrinomonadaceae bacterium]|nr:cyclase family protein [Pyrinomonadaceae bacterium]
MPIYDLSVPISADLPTYPSDPGIQIDDWETLARGGGANVSALHFGAHTGTHVDAPAHFIEGTRKVEALDLGVLIGEAEVIEVPKDRLVIDAEFVAEHCKPGTERVVFKTRNSTFWRGDLKTDFRTDFTYLDLRAAQWLVEQGVRLVGIDYLSIEKFGSRDHETHRALLSKEVIILEGLNLADVPAGKYELICLPLRLRTNLGDGAPARAVLRTLE